MVHVLQRQRQEEGKPELHSKTPSQKSRKKQTNKQKKKKKPITICREEIAQTDTIIYEKLTANIIINVKKWNSFPSKL
jgi:hypothetical protein